MIPVNWKDCVRPDGEPEGTKGSLNNIYTARIIIFHLLFGQSSGSPCRASFLRNCLSFVVIGIAIAVVFVAFAHRRLRTQRYYSLPDLRCNWYKIPVTLIRPPRLPSRSDKPGYVRLTPETKCKLIVRKSRFFTLIQGDE